MLHFSEIEKYIKQLLKKYNADYALVFGSYARNEATPDSDIDVVVFGGDKFEKCDIFAFAEDLRALTGKDVDAFEINEVNPGTPFYSAVMNEGRKIA